MGQYFATTSAVQQPGGRSNQVVDPGVETVAALFERQVARTPQAIALIQGNARLSYAQLEAAANRLAHYLLGQSLGPESIVALALPRSEEMVIALLAVLKVGAAYLPLDPSYPQERLRFMVTDAAAACLLTTHALRVSLAEVVGSVPAVCLDDSAFRDCLAHYPDYPPTQAQRTVAPSCLHPAYIIYTSGSTGRPKGVIGLHYGLINRLAWMASHYPFDTGEVVFAKSSLSFIDGTTELLAPLVSGATVVLASAKAGQDPTRMAQELAAFKAGRITVVPSLLAALLDEGNVQDLRTCRMWFTSGERLTKALAERFVELLPDARLVNLYGSSEVSGDCLYSVYSGGEPQIGQPVPNNQVYVLDEQLRLCQAGEVGELYVGGCHLARGYLGRAALTAERFVANPFGPVGSCLFRTGDLVRKGVEGEFEFIGREDQQVKIRGFRIEMGEIESALLEAPGVTRAVVTVGEQRSGEMALVAYLVPGSDYNRHEVRAWLASRIAHYMLPATFVELVALPQTPNGKIDRLALPSAARQVGTKMASTRQEQMLADLFAQMLDLDRVGIDDNFFELGGHSLLASRLVNRVRRVFDVELAVSALFEAPTVAQFARLLDQAASGRPALEPRQKQAQVPLSFGQEALWLLSRLEEDTLTSYHLPYAFDLQGCVDTLALDQAMCDLVARHEVLRTLFKPSDTVSYQSVIAADSLSGLLTIQDVTEAQLVPVIAQELRQPFDLEHDLPLRAWLFRMGRERSVLLVNLHHAAADGASIPVLFGDLAQAYTARCTGDKPVLAALPVQYRDFSQWQCEVLGSPNDPASLAYRQLEFWRDTLANLPQELALPTDYTRPAGALRAAGCIDFQLDSALLQRLQALALACRVSLFMILHATLAALLDRLGAGHDLPIGAPTDGRTDDQLKNLVGYFVNSVLLRTDTSGNPSFVELVQRVREVDLRAFAHQDVPFGWVVEMLNPERMPSRHPLFQVMLNVEYVDPEVLNLPGLSVLPRPLNPDQAKFDLVFEFSVDQHDAKARLEYAQELFDEATAQRIAGYFRYLLEQVVADPDRKLSDFQIMSPQELGRVSAWSRQAESEPFQPQSIYACFEQQVQRQPEYVALRDNARVLTYGELDRQANRLANRLRSLGVTLETRVAVAIERSIEQVVATLAVLKAGGCYVPLYAGLPLERRQRILDETTCHLVLTDDPEHVRDDGPSVLLVNAAVLAEGDERELQVAVPPSALAYIMYTSGSTGEPKGIEVAQAGIIAMVADPCWGAGRHRVVLHSPYAFDASTFELWLPLLTGGEVIVAPPGPLTPASLRWLCKTHSVSTIFLTSSLLNVIVQEDIDSLSQLQYLGSGGEAASFSSFSRLARHCPSLHLINMYGPTEITVYATRYLCASAQGLRNPIPIGSARLHTAVYVLDEQLRYCPIGVVGELYLAGNGLARGYLGLPVKTAERFVADKLGSVGTRMMRTGDLVRWREDGLLEFVGRDDAQVKIRGFRIELGEIETALLSEPGLQACTVMVREDLPGKKRLVAYVVVTDAYDEAAVQASLGKRLPDYMVPADFVILSALPINANGKIDRKALPAPQRLSGSGRAPSSAREAELVQLFSTLLGVDGVSVDDSFFALGGDSILSIQLVSRARSAGLALTLADVFRHKTPAVLAAVARDVEPALTLSDAPLSGLTQGELDQLSAALPGVQEVLPLSPLQQGLHFHSLYETQGPDPYLVQLALTLDGPLDVAALRAAVAALFARHEALRIAIPQVEGLESLVQVVCKHVSVPWLEVDLSAEADPEAAWQAVLEADRGERLDLALAPLARFQLVRLGQARYRLLMTNHHMLLDGWSMPIVVQDLLALYGGEVLGTGPALREQFAWLATQDKAAARTAWRDALAGLEGPTLLAGQPLTVSPVGLRQQAVSVDLDADLTSALEALAKRHELTLGTVLQGAWAILLSRQTGQHDVVFGITVSGRPAELARVEQRIGLFINTVPLRVVMAPGESLMDLLGRIQSAQAGLLAHQHLGLTEIQGQAGYGELFDSLVVFENYPFEGSWPSVRGVTLSALDAHDATHYPVSLMVQPAEQLKLRLDYRPDVVTPMQAQAWLTCLETILRGLAQPGERSLAQLQTLSTVERAALQQWNATDHQVEAWDVVERFMAQARLTPQAIALEQGDECVTYAQLDEQSSRLAHTLLQEGVGAEDLVAVMLPRTPAMVVALLGVLKSGAAYLPLDPSYPPQRLQAMLEDAQPKRVLDSLALPLATTLPSALPKSDRDQLAYVIYTSGSTGRPKGVAVTHRGISSLVEAQAERFGIDSNARVLQFASVSFDASVSEVFVTLLSGARLVLADAQLMSAERLAGLVERQHITCATLPPALLSVMDPESFPGYCTIVMAGEAANANTVLRWAKGRRLINAYGPTESTVCATMTQPLSAQASAQLSIGHPIWNTRLHVLDSCMQPCPVGVSGDLYIAGAGLARGYLGQRVLTAERFVADPFADGGGRMYRTGDLACWQADGSLMFQGRSDQQVKIRGFRIELGEIETQLSAQGGVTACAVTAREGRLVAYVVPGEDYDEAAVQAGLTQVLPDYMVPRLFVTLAALPQTPNGKLDRKALPAPRNDAGTGRAPATAQEAQLVQLFAEVLGLEHVGVDDSFFALGGDSILSIKLVSRARLAGLTFAPADVFMQRTPARLALVVRSQPLVHLGLDNGTGRIEPTPVMQWFSSRGGPLAKFSQSMLIELPQGVQQKPLFQALQALLHHHALLGATLAQDGGLEVPTAQQEIIDTPVTRFDATTLIPQALSDAIAAAQQDAEQRLAPEQGRMAHIAWFDRGDAAGCLLLTLHHWVVDGVSWRILIEDLAQAYDQASSAAAIALPPVPTSFKRWTTHLQAQAHAPERQAELGWWRETLSVDEPLLGDRPLSAQDTAGDAGHVVRRLNARATRRLLGEVPALFNCGVNDVLLAALALAVADWRKTAGPMLIDIEGHGREPGESGLDLSRTIGWFTTLSPLSVDLTAVDLADAWAGGPAFASLIKQVKERMRRVADHGLGFGLLRWLNAQTSTVLAACRVPQIAFNYLGRFGSAGGAWSPIAGGLSQDGGIDPQMPLGHALSLDALVVENTQTVQLEAHWTFATGLLDEVQVQGLAERWVDALNVAASLQTGGLTPSDVPLSGLTQGELDQLSAALPGVQEVLPLSPLQQGLHFHSLYETQGPDPYLVQLALTLDGPLDVAALRAAVTALFARHEALRIAIPQVEGLESLVQVVCKHVSVPWLEVDLSAEADPEAAWQAVLEADRGERLDLALAPLARFQLVRLGQARYRLLMTNHHMLLDGWSMPIVVQDLLALYGGEVLGTGPALREQFAWLATQDKAAARTAWRDALAGLEGPTLLAGQPLTVSPVGLRQQAVSVDLDADLTSALEALAKRHELTLGTVLQGAWAILLSRQTGQHDVVFGITVSGRPAELARVEQRIGLFINTVPLRVVMAPGESLMDLLGRIQSAQAGLLAHQHLGLTEIQGQAGYGELFDSLVVFENYPFEGSWPSVRGVTLSALDAHDATHYPVSLMVQPAEQLKLRLDYRPDVVTPMQAQAWLTCLETILRGLAQPGERSLAQLQTLSTVERAALQQWNATDHQVEAWDVVERFMAQARLTPQAIALEQGDECVTYAQLDEQSSRLAHTLLQEGVGAEDLVAVMLPRTPAMVVALLGVLKSGAAYLPLDPSYPPQRLQAMLEDAQPKRVLDSLALPLATTLPLALPKSDRDQLAYVIYTSGSTGRPKGVAVTRGALANFLAMMQHTLALSAADRLLAVTTLGFDIAGLELFLPLLVGAVVLLARTEEVRNPSRLIERARQDRATVIQATPVLWEAILAEQPSLSLQTALVGGEATGERLAIGLRNHAARVFNVYGPTETTIWSTCQEITRHETGAPPIGRPLWNTRLHVLDSCMQPCPVGVSGDLYIAGAGLARGYLGQRVLTAERFVADPFADGGGRMYRTGDLACWQADGSLMFQGRSDQQVKIRGFRIELGEIETQLSVQGGVTACAVTAREGRLVAYVVPGEDYDEAAVQAGLTQVLPDYMVPRLFVTLAALPQTPNGKLDRKALPAPRNDAGTGRAPATAQEAQLVQLFAEVLGLEHVGVDDSFFALGGHSLLAASLMKRIRQITRVDLSLRWLFDSPTVAALAARLDDGGEVSALPVLLPLHQAVSGQRLFCVHPGYGLSWSYASLIPYVGAGTSLYGLQSPALSGQPLAGSISELASQYLQAIRQIQPTGPYRLLGWSFGGLVAHAMTAQLEAMGEQVNWLVLLDSQLAGCQTLPAISPAEHLDNMFRLFGYPVPVPTPTRETVRWEEVAAYLGSHDSPFAFLPISVFDTLLDVSLHHYRLFADFSPSAIQAPLIYFRAANATDTHSVNAWRASACGGFQLYDVLANHDDLTQPTAVAQIGPILQSLLTE
ncbi:Long-chain-fatty-acid--CoA ligase [Pseudomonas chlororaphis]|uniref:Long-chain-fatty-acid--CoA ligase n=1 Tax=Pseudomonas chlororaphis TaxID=587753 RepID=A0A3G7TLU6_9PSED|nr:non-ribosomal peptide synthetase [Pseudomonas chlororaphis]AZE48065.1 Long-chain-fatty-acid--CoA ligase [Pseudomonas chlororaphis]